MLSAKAAFAKDRTTGKARMEHRHFATVAAVLDSIPATILPDHTQRVALVEFFATELSTTNPNFSYERFRKAALASTDDEA